MTTLGINLRPDSRVLRQFAATFLLFFAGLGAWIRYKGGPAWAPPACWTAAVLVGGVGLCMPRAILWVYLGMTFATFPIGWVVSFALMSVVYYLIITPLGLILKLSGRDALARRFEPQRASYWKPRPAESEPESYFKQY